MTRIVAIIQARIRSERLPGKVLYELGGMPLIALLIERVRRVKGLDGIVLATGDGPENDALATIAGALGVGVFRGPEQDVLARYAGAARDSGADVVVRLTGDCPLADPEVIGRVLAVRAQEDLDYCTNVFPPSWPDGLDVSVFTRETLERADAEARLPSEREHVVPWMWSHSTLQGAAHLRAANVPSDVDLSASRWTVDTAADYLMLRALAKALGYDRLVMAGWREIRDVLHANPGIVAINADGTRDAGLSKSRAADSVDAG
jgi:spore coat polysaccharide biosynthesis protein SpsF (cytidylyltransferase family)